jgi:hypothetical protein
MSAHTAALRARQAVIRPAGVQQIGHVRRIDDGELGWQGERFRVLANDPVGDRVEGPASDPPTGRPDPGGGARQHVVSGAAGEGQQQDSAGLHTLPAQPGRARHQRARLPGTGSGKDQQRAAWVRRRPALFFVQPVQQARRIEHEHECNQLIRHGQAATRGRMPNRLPAAAFS